MANSVKNAGTVGAPVNWTNPTYAQGAQDGSFAESIWTPLAAGAYDTFYWWPSAIELFMSGGSTIIALAPLLGPTGAGESFEAQAWCNLKGIAAGADTAGLMAKLLPSAVNDADFGVRMTKYKVKGTAEGGGSSTNTATDVINLTNFGFSIPQHAMVYNAQWRMYGKSTADWSGSNWRVKAWIDCIELTLYYTTRSGILMKQVRRT